MKIPLPTTRRKARIEIIPLIDVIFFLLATFVMVSLSMVKNQGISVNLPSVATGASQERKAAVTVTVTKAGDIYLNQAKLAPGLLPQRLKQLKAENPDVRVFINGDKEAYFGNAIQILDVVRSSGITKVAIQTKQAAPSQK
ncbi:MAG TPA: ExbD/TolR family protein [Candidatus Wunengus sp. YC60]|uniref:ExbD/TolR family protein n=1 Tax=Candidatus Wunengus sp. YC60 TaxID=3367697 RepID=UPI004029126B